MERLPPVAWLRAFEVSARRESFAAASEELGRTSKAISTQVRNLEGVLGVPLFERLGHGLRLTDMGRAYLPTVRRAFEDLSSATTGLFGPLGRTTVTVRATTSFAILWLAPRLPSFRARHPDIDIHLITAIWTDGLPPDHVDLEIRLGDGQWPGHRIERLTRERAVPVCSRETLEKHGSYTRPADLWGRELVQIMSQENYWMSFFREAGIDDPLPPCALTVDNALSAVEMVRAGPYHALLLESLAGCDGVRSRVEVLDDIATDLAENDTGHYILLPDTEDRIVPGALLLRDWLIDAASLRRERR